MRTRSRLGSYLILAVVMIISVVGWQQIRLTNDEKETGKIMGVSKSSDEAVVAITKDQMVASETITQTIDYTQGDLPVITDNSLVPALNPFTYEGQMPEITFQTYVVQRGDTPSTIADSFGIKTETLLGGNPSLSEESSLLQAGVELIILPIDGLLHDVTPGDTLENIVALYGIPTEEIIAYEPNNLEFPYRLYPKTQILVPGGVREVFVWTPPVLSIGSTSSQGSGVNPIVVGTGTFVYPINSRNFTQFYWYGHRAIDIGIPEDTPVYASDTGTVTFAGYDTWGYGKLIVINHGNGYETFYAHLNTINVVSGQIVYQGNFIGGTGNTGRSSGPHIHFEIRLNGNPDNPCWYLGGC